MQTFMKTVDEVLITDERTDKMDAISIYRNFQVMLLEQQGRILTKGGRCDC